MTGLVLKNCFPITGLTLDKGAGHLSLLPTQHWLLFFSQIHTRRCFVPVMTTNDFRCFLCQLEGFLKGNMIRSLQHFLAALGHTGLLF